MAKKENLDKLRVSDLREIVIKLGMKPEKAETFETKKPLIATIELLRATKPETPGQLKKDKKQYLGKAERMRAILMKQPRIRIKIECIGKEKPGVVIWERNPVTKRKEQVYIRGAYTPVQINGFKWLVPHGSYQNVPEQVADIIGDADDQTSKAGEDFLVDREDPKTKKPIRDRLE